MATIDVQNLSRNSPTPSAGLSLLNYGNLPTPDSGVQASLAGTQIGETVAQPLANETNFLSQYFEPVNVAARKASMAQSGLTTTTANQENAAAQATPGLPLARRNLALASTNADLSLVTPAAQARLAGLQAETSGSNIQNQQNLTYSGAGGPQSAGTAQALGSKNQITEAENVAATTSAADAPKYMPYVAAVNDPANHGIDPMTTQADYQTLRSTHPELNLPPMTANGPAAPGMGVDPVLAMQGALSDYAQKGTQTLANRIEASRQQLQVVQAGNPLFAAIGNSLKNGSYVPYHMSPDGKGFTPDDVSQESVEDKAHPGTPILQSWNKTKNLWIGPNNQPDPDQSPRIAARNTILERSAANVGALPAQSGQNPALSGLNAANQRDDPALSKPQQADALQIQRQFNSLYNKAYQPKVQLLQAFDSVAQKAMDPNSTGVPDVDLIDTAGRLYKGGAMTEVQFEAIKDSSGIPASIWNAPQKYGQGKFLTPAQRQDLIGSVSNFKQDLQAGFANDYSNYATKIEALNPNANTQLWLGSANMLDPAHYLKGQPGATSAPAPQGAAPAASSAQAPAPLSLGAPAASPSGTSPSLPVLTPQQAAQAPKGTVFQSTDGRTMTVR